MTPGLGQRGRLDADGTEAAAAAEGGTRTLEASGRAVPHPLLPMALAFAAGILAGRWSPETPVKALFATAGVLWWVAWRQSKSGRGFWLLPLVWILGWLHLTLHRAPLSPWDLRRHFDGQPALARIEGVLEGPPRERMRPQPGRPVRWWSRAVVAVERVEIRNGYIGPASGRVMASLPGRLPGELTAGTRVRVFGVLRRPEPPLAEGLFDWRRHLADRGIHFELATESLRDWEWDERAEVGGSWPARFARWARKSLGRGLPPPEEDERVALLWAMVLGWRTGLTDEVSEPFMRTGAMHLFAISGLHVAVIAGALLAGLRVLRLRREAAGVLTVAALWFYAAATGWQASATRATLMMTVIVGGWALKRPPDLLNSLCAAAWIVLLWDPLQLFQTSFQLSFGVVWFLGLLMPLFDDLVRRWTSTDPLLPPELVPRWRRWWHGGLRWMGGSLAVSTAAWLGSWPLVAAQFHLLSPVGWVANVVAVPLAAAAVISAVASLACAPWAPFFSECFNHGAWFWVGCLKGFCETAAEWPGAFRHVAGPAGWQIVAWYVVWSVAVSARLWEAGRRRWLAVAAVGLFALMAGPAWVNRPDFALTVLPARGGGVVWVDAPGRADDLLVDCGRDSMVEQVVLPFLWARGRNLLPAVVLTHGDIEHTGGAALLVGEMPVGAVVTSPLRFRSPTYRAFLEGLENGSLPGRPRRRIVAAGDTVAGWEVLHPASEDRFSLADDGAMVLRGECRGVRVLLLSDLATAGQEALLARSAPLEAEVVVAGIPSRDEPLPAWLVERIRPRWVIWADAAVPPPEHAGPELRGRLEAAGVRSVSVSDVGAVTLEVRGDRVELRSARAGLLDAWRIATTARPGVSPGGPDER